MDVHIRKNMPTGHYWLEQKLEFSKELPSSLLAKAS